MSPHLTGNEFENLHKMNYFLEKKLKLTVLEIESLIRVGNKGEMLSRNSVSEKHQATWHYVAIL
jgi:hypothetical protein